MERQAFVRYQILLRVHHDTSGDYAAGDVTNKPCPTITVGGIMSNACHFKVEYVEMEEEEVATWLRIETGRWFKNASQTINLEEEPSPTIAAVGISSARRNVYWLEDDGMESKVVPGGKPPYRVPSMAEVEAIPHNGFTVVSTFSGAGGSCLGYRMAGFRVAWANEFIPAAQDVYRLNHPTSILDTRDIRSIPPEDILKATGLGVGDIDLFDGSPPCASFSLAGARHKKWGQTKTYSDTEQRTDDLFFEYVRLLKALQPKTFVAENVSGLIKGSAKGYFLLILAALKEAGYRVEAKLLDAQWLGVPQARQRIIFVGVRNDLAPAPAFPRPLPYRYTVAEAIPWIVSVRRHSGSKSGGNYVQPWEPADGTVAPTVTAKDATVSPTEEISDGGFVEAEADISRFAIGEEWAKLHQGEKSERYLNLIRPNENAPCPTITAIGGNPSVAGVTHPTERRKFSIAELKLICAFPDDFKLTGKYDQQWERLGRSVPPLMMRAIASAVRDEILMKL